MKSQTFQVRHHDLKGRLDPHYYQPKFADIGQKLRACGCPVKKMAEIATIVCGSTPREGSFTQKTEDSVVFFKTLNVQNYYLDPSTLYFISRESHEKRKISEVKEGDILLNIIGANLDVVGRVAIVPSGFKEANINQNITRIRIKNTEELKPYFLATFLGLELAQEQIDKISRQAGQVNLNTKEVGLVQIPLPPPKVQNEVIKIVRDALRNRTEKLREIDRLLRDQNDIVIDRLGVEIDKIKDSDTFILSHEQLEGRMDPEFYRPRYRELERILRIKGKKLGTLATFRTEKINPQDNPEETFRYVEIKDLDEKLGMITTCQQIKGADAPSRARLILKEGDIIIPALEGTLSKVSIITQEYDGAVGTTGFLIAKPVKVRGDFLYAVLRSDIGQWQLERSVTGSIMPSLNKKSVHNIIIPVDLAAEESIAQTAIEYRKKIQMISREVEKILDRAKVEAQSRLMEKP